MNDFTIRVGKNIRKYREEQDMTMEELAVKIGMSQSNLSKIERGEPKKVDYVLLEKIADTLGVTKEEITGWGDPAVKAEKEHQRTNNLLIEYEELPKDHQRIIREIVAFLLYDKNASKDDREILRKLRYITDEARGRILNQLDYEYELERKKQKETSA